MISKKDSKLGFWEALNLFFAFSRQLTTKNQTFQVRKMATDQLIRAQAAIN